MHLGFWEIVEDEQCVWSRRVGAEEKWELREGIYREEVKGSVQNRWKIEVSMAVIGC